MDMQAAKRRAYGETGAFGILKGMTALTLALYAGFYVSENMTVLSRLGIAALALCLPDRTAAPHTAGAQEGEAR